MSKKNLQKQEGLEKLLRYILGVRPDEFGLWPDEEGFVAVKALLAALHDEEGWRGIREAQIMMLVNLPGGQSAFEKLEGRIRLKKELASLPPPAPQQSALPKLLYTAFKPAAWPVIHEKGLFPKAGERAVLLWTEKAQAEKIGRRLAPNPVLVTVQAGAAQRAGALFQPYSELLWLTEKLEPVYLAGPPLPPKEEENERRHEKESLREPVGSFYLEPAEPQVHKGKKKGKYSDAPDWKNQTRRERRRRGD